MVLTVMQTPRITVGCFVSLTGKNAAMPKPTATSWVAPFAIWRWPFGHGRIRRMALLAFALFLSLFASYFAAYRLSASTAVAIRVNRITNKNTPDVFAYYS